MPSDLLHAFIVEDDQTDIDLLQGALQGIRLPRMNVAKTLVPRPEESLDSLRLRFKADLAALRKEGRAQLLFLDVLFTKPDKSEVPWGRNLALDARELAPETAVLLYTKLSLDDDRLVSLRSEQLFDEFIFKSDLTSGTATLRIADTTPLGTSVKRAMESARRRQPQICGVLADLERIVERFRQLTRLANEAFDIQLSDEATTQKFLQILLLATFNDVTREDPLSKRGAKSTRADFIVGDIETLVEIKYVSEKGHIGRIQDEISADMPQYEDREGISTVAFLVYDPDDLCHERDAVKQFVQNQDPRFVVFFI